eukprot:COSAG04_NODE_232_length_19188_cov_43.611190_18_plen_138_part_00
MDHIREWSRVFSETYVQPQTQQSGNSAPSLAQSTGCLPRIRPADSPDAHVPIDAADEHTLDDIHSDELRAAMATHGWTSSADAPDVRAVQPDAEGLVHGVDMHENMRNFFALLSESLGLGPSDALSVGLAPPSHLIN